MKDYTYNNSKERTCQGGGSPSGLVSYKNNVHAKVKTPIKSIVSGFREFMKKVGAEAIILQNKENEKQLLVVLARNHSRYFPEGQRYIKRKIYKRMGKFKNMKGVFLTLTYDPSLVGKIEVWANLGGDTRNFLNTINQYRRRRGWKRVKYFWVVEVQKGTGYPHIHIFFPGLRWLAPKEYILSAWGKGRTRVEMARSVNGASYIVKYIGKMKGWSEEYLALIWWFKRRLYSFSKFFYMFKESNKEYWKLFGFVRDISEDIVLYELFMEGYEFVGFT